MSMYHLFSLFFNFFKKEIESASGVAEGNSLHTWSGDPCGKHASSCAPPGQALVQVLPGDWQLSKLRRSTYEGGVWELMTTVGVN